VFLTLGFGGAAYASPEPKSFADSFRAALGRSEALGERLELIVQAEERRKQAVGGILPSVSVLGSYLVRDSGGGSLSGSISPTTQPFARVTAVQPLFQGFRELAAVRQAGQRIEETRESRRHAVTLLYVDVAEAFETVLTLEADRRSLDAQAELTRRRIAELRSRARIGRSRASEVLELEVSLASLEAERDALGARIGTARESWAFLTGLPAATALRDDATPPPAPAPLETYLARVEARPDVLAASRGVEAAGEGIAVARGAHLPSVDAQGNYYLKRTGVLSDAKWDVALTATLPIFSGGVIQSQVREARSVQAQAELGRERAKRLAEQEIRTYYETLQASRLQLAALERAAELSTRNYDEQSREYRLGLVTNLNVLAALTSSQEILRALDRARRTTRLDLLRLEAAAALRPGAGEGGGDGTL
jgi:outer membrane protein